MTALVVRDTPHNSYASCIPVAKIVNFLPRDATAIAKAILYITFVDCV